MAETEARVDLVFLTDSISAWEKEFEAAIALSGPTYRCIMNKVLVGSMNITGREEKAGLIWRLVDANRHRFPSLQNYHDIIDVRWTSHGKL